MSTYTSLSQAVDKAGSVCVTSVELSDMSAATHNTMTDKQETSISSRVGLLSIRLALPLIFGLKVSKTFLFQVGIIRILDKSSQGQKLTHQFSSYELNFNPFASTLLYYSQFY